VPDAPVSLTPSGPPETVLDSEPEDALDALTVALELQEPGARRAAVADVAARWPRCLDAWAQLGQLARDDAEAYACFRVGYHRGLDRLRRAGWRGSGRVPWAHVPNRGFLRSLAGLSRAAATLGERDEAARCAEFLAQLCPDAPADLLPAAGR
jgi:hypothetical protein